MAFMEDESTERLTTECADFINIAGNEIPKEPDHDACEVEGPPAPGGPPAWRCECPCHDVAPSD
jgi:hypothetical protein